MTIQEKQNFKEKQEYYLNLTLVMLSDLDAISDLDQCKGFSKLIKTQINSYYAENGVLDNGVLDRLSLYFNLDH